MMEILNAVVFVVGFVFMTFLGLLFLAALAVALVGLKRAIEVHLGRRY